MAKVAQLHSNIDRTQYYVLKRENIVGRAEDADIRIDNKVVSRRHARVACAPGSEAYYVEDISARGTWVNFGRIQGRHPLRPGDRICVIHFRNVHPIEMKRMTEEMLKESCDDRRNDNIQAVVDLTFEYADIPDKPPESAAEEAASGLLAKLKSLLSRK